MEEQKKNWEQACIEIFAQKSDDELLQTFNGGLGISAWGANRAIWVYTMKAEMLKRDWDISAITSEQVSIHLSKAYHCRLEGKKLLLTGG